MALSKTDRRTRIRLRIRKIVSGTAERPRLSIYRSNKDIHVQLINDETGKTLASASSLVKEIKKVTGTKTEKASLVGKLIAEKAIQAGITGIVFDRSGYLYHGRVKSLAEAARENGLKF